MLAESAPCGTCGKLLARKETGRPARFCSSACRQRAYRNRAAGRGVATELATEAVPPVDDSTASDLLGVEAVDAEKPVPHLSPIDLLAWRGMLEVHARLLPLLDDELRAAAELSLSEFDVLYQLWIRRGARLRMKRLAAALLITPSGVTRIVSRLEGEGLVRRLSAPGAQAVRAELTEAGQVRLDAAMDIHFAGVQRLFSSALSEEESRTLVFLWARLVRASGTEG